MKLSQLRCFLAVVEAGTVRQAARNLNLSQSSVTKSIQQLEEDLQAELFVRRSHGLTPTSVGRMLVSRATSIERELREIRNDTESMLGGVSGEIRISASPSVSVGILPNAMIEFCKARPNVAVRIEEAVYPDVLPRVRKGELDLAISLVPETPTDDDLECELLLQDYVTPAVRAGHPLAIKGKLVLADLLDQKWVIYRRSRTGRDIFEQTFLSNGIDTPPNAIECTSFACTLALIESSDYVSLVPTQIFAHRLGRLPITPLFLETPMPPWNETVISRPRHELSPLCLAFLAELRRAAEQARLAAG